MTVFATGTQYLLQHGEQRAIITELGATLRSYEVDGQELLWGFEESNSPLGAQGQHLMPWPNRIRDGRWVLDGVQHQLSISEPERMCAIHGLVRWVPWSLVEQSEAGVTLSYLLHPQPGWPGLVRLELEHRLTDDGLVVEARAENLGGHTVPFGYGAHPYLLAPDGSIDDAVLQVPFESVLAVDERLLPTGLRPVEGAAIDLRQPKALAGIGLDTALTDPHRESDAKRGEHWSVTLTGSKHRTTLWGDESMGWVQLYTPGDGVSIAVEPMTCGPDAFNPGPTHEGVAWLAPDESFVARWGLQQTLV